MKRNFCYVIGVILVIAAAITGIIDANNILVVPRWIYAVFIVSGCILCNEIMITY